MLYSLFQLDNVKGPEVQYITQTDQEAGEGIPDSHNET
jgi:hypothetical protein